MKRYRARWLFPGNSPPIQNATVEIQGSHIERVSAEDSDPVDLGDAAIIPGLINAHTHFEFSSIPTPLEPLADFTSWIPAVIAWRQKHPDGILDSIHQGVEESLRSGVTTAAEIATTDWRANVDETTTKLQVWMFREILGLSDEAVDSQLQNAREFLGQPSLHQVKVGLSPHSPYSLHPDLFNGLCQLAELQHVPLVMHLAESPAEMQFLETGTGKLAEMLQHLGVARPELFDVARRPVEYLDRLDCGVPVLVVHGNYLGQQEIDFLQSRPNMSVVYCPRTHAAMQPDPHPWRKLLAAGINVVLGTDSRASNPDLSIWNELQFLHQKHPALPASELLKLTTLNAANALQYEQAGVLERGRVADLCVVSLRGNACEAPEETLLRLENKITGVMKQGEWIVAPQV